MKMVLKTALPILVGVVFCLALHSAVNWLLTPFGRPLHGFNCETTADLLRASHPHRLVDPAGLKPVEWMWSETRARARVMALSLGVLAGIVVTVAYLFGKSDFANKALQETSNSARSAESEAHEG